MNSKPGAPQIQFDNATKILGTITVSRIGQGILLAGSFFLGFIYILYLYFVISKGQGPIDYETFMNIGRNFIAGNEIYGTNSYYPLPYVVIFGGLSLLPKWVSLLLWLSVPVTAAILISRGKLWSLAFAPLFAHFVGGQSALPAMLGVWGYQRSSEKFSGGLWLSLATLKPQLCIFPVAWAARYWLRDWRKTGRPPRSLIGFVTGAGAIYLPSFIIYPTWPIDWLKSPRPLFERAMSGIVPRTLLLLNLPVKIYWLFLSLFALGLFLLIYKRLTFSRFILWSFVISPLVHDYDLIQLIPLLKTPEERRLAILVSLPTWIVIAAFYANDRAWYAVTIIAPVLLLMSYCNHFDNEKHSHLFLKPQVSSQK